MKRYANTRPADHLYPIRTYSPIEIVVAREAEWQFLAGYLDSAPALVCFDGAGEQVDFLLEPAPKSKRLPADYPMTLRRFARSSAKKPYAGALRQAASRGLEHWQNWGAAIRVRRFMLPEHNVGVADIDLTGKQLRETLEKARRPGPIDPEAKEVADVWLPLGCFVFYWGRPIYFDGVGYAFDDRMIGQPWPGVGK